MSRRARFLRTLWILANGAFDTRRTIRRRWSSRRPLSSILILTSEKTSGKEDIELLRKLRLARPHTRLIILTDESAPSYVIDSMREHAFSYFSKPFSLDALAEMVQLATDAPCWDDGIEVVSGTQNGFG